MLIGLSFKLLKLKVRSKGCASCTLTAVRHLLKIPGVKGVRAVGDYLIVVMDPSVDHNRVLNNEELNLYYRVVHWEVVEEAPHSFKLSNG